MRIAIDAMGGDHAPAAIVEGAIMAARDFAVGIDLIGNEPQVREALVGYDLAGLDVTVSHAEQVVAMDDSPSMAVRR